MHEGRRPMAGSGAGLVGGAWGWGVGHASTVRPDPTTLGAVGEPATRRRLLDLVPEATLRHTPDGSPFVTDEGHHLLDCTLPPGDLEPVATALKATLGVVDHGLFLTHADEVLLGDPDGSVRVLRRSGAKAG